jgi:hypothetical protein
MSRIALHFPKRAKALLYGNLLLSLASGTSWFALHRWFRVEGEFGPEPSRLEPWLMKIHGASAFLALIGFGYLLASHVHFGWRSKRNRTLGVALVSIFSALIVSGYLLYYGGGDDFRDVVGLIHLGLGLAFPCVLAGHVFVGHRRRARQI